MFCDPQFYTFLQNTVIANRVSVQIPDKHQYMYVTTSRTNHM